MLILKLLSKIIKILESAASPAQLAWGFVLGMFVGFIPGWNLLSLIFVVLIIILNVNIAFALFSYGIFTAFAYLLDGVFHKIGVFLLMDSSALTGFWTALYTAPVVPYTKFYNTVVLGSFLGALLLTVPMFFAAKYFVILYRTQLSVRIKKWKIVKVLGSSKLVEMYKKIRRLGD